MARAREIDSPEAEAAEGLSGEIEATRHDGVLAITLNRPDKLNTITQNMIRDFNRLLDETAHDGTRVITFSGKGRAFCAGADLSALGQDSSAILSFVAEIQALFLRLLELPIPVIATVNGVTAGGGLELILAADFAIASDTARVSDGHTNFGVIPGAGGATILPKRIPVALAKYMVLTGNSLSANELRTAGLFAEVVPASELAARAQTLAEQLAKKSPLGMSMVKKLMQDSLDVTSPAAALSLELEANRVYAGSDDMAEGVSAFLAKRDPNYPALQPDYS